MRNILVLLLIVLAWSCSKPQSDQTIVIRGKVEFPDSTFKMMIFRYKNFERQCVDSFQVNPDNSYEVTMKVEEPGVYTLDCQKWQSVQFWAEDEDLSIDFRGRDTAKIVIKNPPYVHIQGGPDNELMNLLNFDKYRNYQMMIAISKGIYKTLSDQPEKYNELSGELFSALSNDGNARTRYIVEHYADRKSVMAAVYKLNPEKDSALINKTLATLEQKFPGYQLIETYRQEVTEKMEKERKVAIGQIVPDFLYATREGKKVSPGDFRGKFLIIDFWASWCGPCRKEIPNLKEVYAAYKDKGVEILGVSIDKKEAEWLKALDEEKMDWTQIHADDEGKQLMSDFQFSGIPFIILLDENGTIRAKNLRGDNIASELDALIAEKTSAEKQ